MIVCPEPLCDVEDACALRRGICCEYECTTNQISPPDWPGCSVEKQCLAGDIMPTSADDVMADALSCCAENESCKVDAEYPEMGGSCQPTSAEGDSGSSSGSSSGSDTSGGASSGGSGSSSDSGSDSTWGTGAYSVLLSSISRQGFNIEYVPPSAPSSDASVSWMVIPQGANGVEAADVVSGVGSICSGAFPLSMGDSSPVLATLDCSTADLPSGSTVTVWLAENMGLGAGPILLNPSQTFTYPHDFPSMDQVGASMADENGFKLSSDVDHPSANGMIYWYVQGDIANTKQPSLDQMRSGAGAMCAGSLSQPIPAVFTSVNVPCQGLVLGNTYNVYAAVDSDGSGMAMSWGNGGNGYAMTVAGESPSSTCTEGLRWDQHTCYPKECINGEVITAVISCPETESVPCKDGRYIPDSNNCCSSCTKINNGGAANGNTGGRGGRAAPQNWAYGMPCESLPPNWCTQNPGCFMHPEEMECEPIDCEHIYSQQQCARIPRCFWYGYAWGEDAACGNYEGERMSEYYSSYYQQYSQYLSKPRQVKVPANDPFYLPNGMFSYENFLKVKYRQCATLDSQQACKSSFACQWSSNRCSRDASLLKPPPSQNEQESYSINPIYYLIICIGGVLLGLLTVLVFNNVCRKRTPSELEEPVILDAFY